MVWLVRGSTNGHWQRLQVVALNDQASELCEIAYFSRKLFKLVLLQVQNPQSFECTDGGR